MPTAPDLLRKPWVGALLIVLIGVGFLHALVTTSGIVYSNHSDLIAEHVGIKTIGREAVRKEGLPPFWNPSMNGGAPALANPQAMYLFPFDLLFLVLPLGEAANTVILLNFLLAGLGMFLFCRRHLRHPASAVICAVAYMLSHRFLAMIYCGWLPKMGMVALTPLLFWACDRLLDRPDRRRIAGAAVVGALVLLQGDMQQVYYASVAAGLYIAARLAAVGWARSGRAFSRFALAGLIAGLLAAPALWPELEYVSLSTRTQPNYTYLLEGSPAPSEIRTLFDPHDRNVDGTVRDEFWENNFYFGYWLLPLWLAALVGTRRRRACALLVGLGLMVFLCFDTGFVRWIYAWLPGFNLFRHPSRILFLAQFAALLLAGLGMDALLADEQGRGRRVLFVLGAAVAAAAGWLAPWTGDAPARACGCILMASLGAVVFFLRRREPLLAGLLLLAPIADSAFRFQPLIVTKPLGEALPRHAFHDLLDRRNNQGRVLVVGRNPLLYDTAAYYGIDLVNGAASMQLRHYVDYFSVMEYPGQSFIPDGPVNWLDCSQIARWQMLRALDVRYIVCDPSRQLNPNRCERIWEDPGIPLFNLYRGVRPTPVAVWRLIDPLGPAYFATSVQFVADREQSLHDLVSGSPATVAYVFGLDRSTHDLDFAGGTAAFVERGLNRYRYRIESRGRNFLILSQIWYPDWVATLDGRPIELYRTNHALLGCFVPAGSHELTLEMTSPLFDWGLGAAGLGVVLAVLLSAARPCLREG